MKIHVFILLTLLPWINSFGQEGAIDYDFYNSALKQVEKYDSTCFQLQSKPYACNLSETRFDDYMNNLQGKIDTATLKEIIQNAQVTPSMEFEFDPKLISKETGAKIISPSRIGRLQLNKNVSCPLNKRMFYICSMPVFDNHKNFAVIDFGGGTELLAMLGKKYLFAKTKNGWKLIATFDHWIS